MRRAAKLKAAVPLFAALGDETRLRIVTTLSTDGPMSIVRLADGGEISRQAVTKHLRALQNVGLVSNSRQGRENIWTLETKRLSEAEHYLDQISQQWDAAIERLRAFVEDPSVS